MHKAAVFAFATAVAAVAVALMLQLLPDSAELTYGEPLPYLKATREGDRLKIWLEDYAGLRPERVWLYVNGELKASGGPGTSVYARCGDRVAALAQYEAGVRRVEAEVRCTRPIKAPEGGEVTVLDSEVKKQYVQAYTTLMHGSAGVPYEVEARCDRVDAFENEAEISVRITAREGYVACARIVREVFSWGLLSFETSPASLCGRQLVFEYYIYGGDDFGMADVRYYFLFYRYAEAPAAQYAGAGGFEGHMYFRVWSKLRAYIDVEVRFNGALIAICSQQQQSHSTLRQDDVIIDVEGVTNALVQRFGRDTHHVTLFRLSNGSLAGYSTVNQNFQHLSVQLHNSKVHRNAIIVIFECVETDPDCRPWGFTITGYDDHNLTYKTIRTLGNRPWSNLLTQTGWLGSLPGAPQPAGEDGEYEERRRSYFHYNVATGQVGVMNPVAFGALFANALLPVDVPPKDFTINATLVPTTTVFWS